MNSTWPSAADADVISTCSSPASSRASGRHSTAHPSVHDLRWHTLTVYRRGCKAMDWDKRRVLVIDPLFSDRSSTVGGRTDLPSVAAGRPDRRHRAPRGPAHRRPGGTGPDPLSAAARRGATAHAPRKWRRAGHPAGARPGPRGRLSPRRRLDGHELAGVGGKSIAVTSVEPDASRTSNVLKIATAASQDNRTILLIDADVHMRRLSERVDFAQVAAEGNGQGRPCRGKSPPAQLGVAGGADSVVLVVSHRVALQPPMRGPRPPRLRQDAADRLRLCPAARPRRPHTAGDGSGARRAACQRVEGKGCTRWRGQATGVPTRPGRVASRRTSRRRPRPA